MASEDLTKAIKFLNHLLHGIAAMNEVPAEVTAFLANPAPDFLQIMQQVAPDKEGALTDAITKHHISFEVDEKAARIRFAVRHSRKSAERTIVVGVRCLPRLWATAYAYLKLYNAFAAASEHAEADVVAVEFFQQPHLTPARHLLQWAILSEVHIRKNERSGTLVEGFEEFPPEGLPVPFAPCEPGTDEHLTEELCWAALGFILHHELAHIIDCHVGLDWDEIDSLKRRISRAQEKNDRKTQAKLERELQGELTRYVLVEKEADTDGAKWILEGVESTTLAFKMRALGIAIGLSWLASTDPYIGPTNHPAYPPGYDRLFQTLEKFVVNPDHPVWAVVAFILALHLQNANKWIPNPEGFKTPKDIANWATNIIAQESRFANP